MIGTDGKLTTVERTSYEREVDLQQLITDHPEMIPGMSQDQPVRWLLVKQEGGIPKEAGGSDWWSVDHILIDQFAIPTFVEVKRSSDTRARREVVAQMLDYVANATLYLGSGTLKAWFESGGEESRGDLFEFLLGEELDPDEFWIRADENLVAGRVRCIFVADAIPDSLRVLVEFLNEHLRSTEVYAVELPQYLSATSLPGVRVIVPKLIGNTVRAQVSNRDRTSVATRTWDEESIMDAFLDTGGEDVTQLAREILEWARRNDLRIDWGRGKRYGSVMLGIDVEGHSYPFASVWTSGTNVYLEIELQYLKTSTAFEDVALREEVIRKFNQIPTANADERKHSTRPNMALTAFLTDQARERLFEILTWMMMLLRSDSTNSSREATN